MRLHKYLRVLFPLFGVSFTIWMIWGYQADGVPEYTLRTNSAVKVSDDGTGIHFQPRANKRATGIIFLPGGMVDPTA